MQWILQFFDWEVSCWKELAVAGSSNCGMLASDLDIQEGQKAYAHWKANIHTAMCDLCAWKWKEIPDKLILAGEFKDNEMDLVEIQ